VGEPIRSRVTVMQVQESGTGDTQLRCRCSRRQCSPPFCLLRPPSASCCVNASRCWGTPYKQTNRPGVAVSTVLAGKGVGDRERDPAGGNANVLRQGVVRVLRTQTKEVDTGVKCGIGVTANAAPQRCTIVRGLTTGLESPLRDAVYVSLCDVHSRIIRRSLSTVQRRLLDWVATAISPGKTADLTAQPNLRPLQSGRAFFRDPRSLLGIRIRGRGCEEKKIARVLADNQWRATSSLEMMSNLPKFAVDFAH